VKTRGFSLIETVVSSTLLAVAAIVALGALPTLTITSNRARFRVNALQLSQSLLEKQRAAPWPAINLWPHQQTLADQVMPGTGVVFQPTLEIQKVAGYDPEQLRKVLISVKWKERDRWQTVQQETLVSHVPRF